MRQFLITTKKGPLLQTGKTVTLSLFGEMQKFEVLSVTLDSNDNASEEESKAAALTEDEPTADTKQDQ